MALIRSVTRAPPLPAGVTRFTFFTRARETHAKKKNKNTHSEHTHTKLFRTKKNGRSLFLFVFRVFAFNILHVRYIINSTCILIRIDIEKHRRYHRYFLFVFIMAEGYQDDAAEFSVEDVEGIVRVAIHHSLNENQYNSKKINEWSNNIVTSCLKELQALARPFKYIITCVIMQKTGAGLNSSTSMHWDASKDGLCKVPWQNATMHCIVTVYGLSVNIDDPQDADM